MQIQKRNIPQLLGCVLVWALSLGCPSSGSQTRQAPPAGPEEKVYRLSVGNDLQVPIAENEALVYRFDAQIGQDGLYQFETLGEVDTLCALVHGRGSKERFVVVRDIGGAGENCRLMWAFPPGLHHFKVRVDGRGRFRVRLRRVSWGRQVKLKIKRDKPFTSNVGKSADRHIFRFRLPASRLIQLQATGKGLLQCVLRKGNGQWLSTPDFRQPYGACTLGMWLPAGQYSFELRSDQPDTAYRLLYQQIRMQPLPTDRLREGFLQGQTFDIYRIHLKDKRHHVIRTYGRQWLYCTLEDRLGHVVVRHRRATDGINCHLSGQFAPGKYYLRIRLRRKRGGVYQVSLMQKKYQQLPAQIDRKITPDFQQPIQLYRLNIPKARLYQIEVSGRPLACLLQSNDRQQVPLMNLSESSRCLLFANFQAGSYFLKVIPTTREETAYRLRVVQYKPPRGKLLEDQHPRLVGPVYPGFRRVFTIQSKRPQLLTLETRGSLDTVCTLYDSSGVKMARDDDSGKRLNCQLTRYLKPGTYRLRVRVGGRRSGLFWVQRRRKKLPWLKPGRTFLGKLLNKKPKTYMLRVHRTGLYGFRTESKLDTICKILDNDWRQIARDDDSGDGKNCFLAQLLTPGIYSFQVRLYRRQTGNFRLVVDKLKLRELRPGSPLSGTLGAPHWTNFYRARVTQPGLYVFRTQGNLDTKCALLNEQSKQIAKNDDANTRDKNCEMIENLQVGVYFFQVRLYKHARQRRGPFIHKALFAQKKAPVFKIVPGKWAQGTLRPREITRYLFTIKKPGNYRIETHGRLDPKCILLDGKRRRLAIDDDNGPGRNCRIQWRLSRGQYELQVRPATSTRNRGTYRLSVMPLGR